MTLGTSNMSIFASKRLLTNTVKSDIAHLKIDRMPYIVYLKYNFIDF